MLLIGFSGKVLILEISSIRSVGFRCLGRIGQRFGAWRLGVGSSLEKAASGRASIVAIMSIAACFR